MIIGDGIVLGAGGVTASIFVTGVAQTDTVTATNGTKTLTGKWTQKPNPLAHGLPDGYTELECIIGGSTQYINTGFTPNQDTRVVLDHKFIENATYSCGFASRVNPASRGFHYSADFNGDKTKSFVQYGGTYADAGNLYGSERHIVDFNKNNFYHDNVLKKTFSYTSFTAPGPLYLFAQNENGTINLISDMILYRCQIYDNGQIVRDFIPSKRNSDSIVGLYDIVNGVFYENAGTGAFTAGAEVPQTIGGFLIKPIRDFGTWTVTATNGEKTAIQDVLVDVITEYEIEMDYNKLWLYRAGNEFEYVTGGYNAYAYRNWSGGTACTPTLVKNDTSMSGALHINASSHLERGVISTNSAIKIEGYSKLKFHFVSITTGSAQYTDIGLDVVSQLTDVFMNYVLAEKYLGAGYSASDTTLEVDVSGISADAYVLINFIGWTSCTVDKIWLEK